ncbi:MAG: MmgE/PrpD family protein, partial [Candidatus Dormibacteraceae bacterium]
MVESSTGAAEVSQVTATLSEYVADAGQATLPSSVRERARLHILDAIAAMVSGSRLGPGQIAAAWCRSHATWESGATVVGTERCTAPFAAALVNGMAAHADETDDSHPESLSHPGCAVVPAALAAAESIDASGDAFLRAVVVGYDVGCRMGRAVGLKKAEMQLGRPSSHALVGIFGASAAAAVVYGLRASPVRHALSYAAQSCGGTTSWMGAPSHVQKSFVFGGLPASRGLMSASLVAAGFDGVEDAFANTPNWLDATSRQPRPEELGSKLGERFEIEQTTLKKYAVGSPVQAAVEAALLLTADGVRASEIDWIEVRIPADAAPVVDANPVPSINAQYLVAATLIAGRFSFQLAHDVPALRRPDVIALLART